MHTRGDVIIKPTVLNDIYSSHTHGSDPVRIDMLKGYNKVKERSIDSEESTRVILSYCIEQMGASSVAQLPKLESEMIPSLAFVPEEDVVDCYNILMTDFPESALNVAVYFEETYIGKRLPDNCRRIPPFPIRMWNMFERVREKLSRTNNAVEE